ncbi:hypothetical protein NQ318_002377 [Aromia moschata]|uniref:Uncharacterized protein n=1 Tax=Aromia moschata TaxID=1265417 RepID=A0AAV8YHH0_9CUCU|nr:hypothetical protein NQ318_002377 [Aromia moschata]
MNNSMYEEIEGLCKLLESLTESISYVINLHFKLDSMGKISVHDVKTMNNKGTARSPINKNALQQNILILLAFTRNLQIAKYNLTTGAIHESSVSDVLVPTKPTDFDVDVLYSLEVVLKGLIRSGQTELTPSEFELGLLFLNFLSL